MEINVPAFVLDMKHFKHVTHLYSKMSLLYSIHKVCDNENTVPLPFEFLI